MSVINPIDGATMNLNEINQFISDLVQKTGRVIYDAYYKEKNLTDKICFADIVTETDVLVEKTLINAIKQKYPTHEFIGEESTSAKVDFTRKPVWIIDPVDGTTNFVHSFPHCCISIAFYVDRQAQIGIIYNPITNEMYSAIKGQGAYLNGRTLRPSGQTELNKSQIITEFGSSRNSDELDIKVGNMRVLIDKVHSLRAMGSAALNSCFVANGAADAYYEHGMHVWDIAAGALICAEAGCYVAEPDGQQLNILNRRFLVAATKELAEQIIPLLKHVPYESD